MLANAQTEAVRNRALRKDGAVSQQALDASETTLRTAQADAANQRAQLDQMLHGTRAEDLAAWRELGVYRLMCGVPGLATKLSSADPIAAVASPSRLLFARPMPEVLTFIALAKSMMAGCAASSCASV